MKKRRKLNRKSFTASRRLRVETLESRRLLAVFNVTTFDDVVAASDGVLSLREAIDAANSSPGADEITFSETVAQPIVLGLGELTITDTVTITGSGQATTVIDANQQSRVLNVVGESVDVTLQQMTLTGGRTTGSNEFINGSRETTHSGGGIRFDSAGTLALVDSTLSGNSTTGESASGGGIYSYSGSVTLSGSTLSGNSTVGGVAFGGGIYTYRGSVALTDSVLSGNSTADSWALGGGISTSSGSVTLTGSTLSGNSTAGVWAVGGGISTVSGSVTLIGSTLSGNSTAGDSASGGGVRTGSGSVTLTGSTLSDNRTGGDNADGGGIYTSSGSVTITGSTLSGNRTGGDYADGGGLWFRDSAVGVTGSTITGNVSSGRGGGIGMLDDGRGESLAIHNSIVAGNMDAGGVESAPDFVAPDDPANNLDVRSSLIGDSTGTSLFDSSTPDSNGNVVGVDWTTVLASHTVDDQVVPLLVENGGPIQTVALLPNAETTTNPAIDAGDNALAKDPAGNDLTTDARGLPFVRIAGGGVDMGAYELQPLPVAPFVVTTHLDELDYSNNSGANPQVSLREAIALANDSPGADEIAFSETVTQPIVLGLGELTITDTVTITGSGQATTVIDANQQSRVLNVVGESVDVTLQQMTLTGGRTTGSNEFINGTRETTHSGGGIRFDSTGTLALVDSTLSGNSTTGESARGGGIYAKSGSVTLTGSTLSDNYTVAEYAGGGGISTDIGPVTLTGSTLSGNYTFAEYAGGGGISTYSGAVTLTGSTLSGNYTFADFVGGGGIDSWNGSVSLTGSTLSGNSNAGYGAAGGGVFAWNGSVMLMGSTLSGNSNTGDLASGGGIFTYAGLVTLTNSTLSGNRNTGFSALGGGIFSSNGSVKLTGSTLAGNVTSREGGGIVFSGQNSSYITSLTLDNSIVAGNLDDGTAPDFLAPDDSDINLHILSSLIGDSTGTSFVDPSSPDLIGSVIGVDWTTVLASHMVDGQVVPLLTDNGGPVQTVALLPNTETTTNPAIDAGNNAVGTDLLTDARGLPRITDGDGDGTATVDMGAFESPGDVIIPPDITAPVITSPSPATLEATSATGVDRSSQAVQDFLNGFAIDDDNDPNPTVVNDAPATLPLGTTSVTVTATDASGNASQASVNLTVVDTTAPSVTAPPNLTIEADTATGASVAQQEIIDFLSAATATDIVDASVTITNDFSAVGELPVGVTTVSFTGTDDSGNQATVTAQITVNGSSASTLDFGDAPTSFPVTEAQDGARHTVGDLFLGSSVGAEFDGVASPTASSDTGDDGVTSLATAIASSTSATRSSLAVVASAAGKLDAWIDFNSDGTWQAAEQIFDSVDVSVGANTLSYQVPAGATVGGAAARFRLSSAGGLNVTGAASDGEVEDYVTTLTAVDSSAVNVTSITPGSVTIEESDSDMIVREGSTILFQGPAASLAVLDFTGTGGDDTLLLNASLVDFPGTVGFDGGTGRDILQVGGSGQSIDTSDLPAGSIKGVEVLDLRGTGENHLSLSEQDVSAIPDAGQTLRVVKDFGDTITFRSGTFKIDSSRVEDGQLIIAAQSASSTIEFSGEGWTNPLNRLDVDGSGTLEPLDVLLILNELGRKSYVQPGTSTLVAPESLGGSFPMKFYDTSGDNEVAPIDALRIINALGRGEGKAPTGEAFLSISALPSVNQETDEEDQRESVDLAILQWLGER
ncbi:HYR domain protein [Rosistilla oblonga]|uniref:choice-of-anchor Q domain-containing protein n=1 Tax=Rosistilla oblonga TaxID=2527990 RepID=UPI00118A8907|nr:choice-of-anchor Q domain-containing protein [Rosistilla oblonga]QDV15149.1 HYR domain protein [Rosistilla oblonga]